MCGIIGYAGTKSAAPILLDGLEKLEYRGYDSAGIVIVDGSGLQVSKTRGRLKVLRDRINGGAGMSGCTGVGHTRWATHGEPNDVNSHPHMSGSGRVALVHNGIVENYTELRDFLSERGYEFKSDTDTEIVVQLIDFLYHGDPVSAVREAVSFLKGSFSLGIVFADYPYQLIGVRKDSPLIVGLGDGENFIASDVPAILKHTRKMFRLDEYELAVVTKDSVTVFDRMGDRVDKAPIEITWDANSAEKGGYEHFMLKEIMEQPDVMRRTVSPRTHSGHVDLELKSITDEDIRNIDRIYIIACGSAYHVGCLGKLFLEKYTRAPVSVELASEFRYADPIITSNTLTIVISQSGETIDTLFAMREARKLGSRVMSVVNVVGSTIAAESEDVVYTWAGPEIAVATTKAYSAQLSVMYLIALYIGRVRGIVSVDTEKRAISELDALPGLMQRILDEHENIKHLASMFFASRDIFFIGRNIDHALALEGSLKLKEISYIHSEAYAAGELKHGTISLIEPGTLVVALMTYKPLADKMVSNAREVKARGAVVMAVAANGVDVPSEAADYIIRLPECPETVIPSLTVLPLQLFAYYVALLKGCDIDKPRNLAKSVTVE